MTATANSSTRFSWPSISVSRLFAVIGLLNLVSLLAGIGLLARNLSIMDDSIEVNSEWDSLTWKTQELDNFIVEMRHLGESMFVDSDAPSPTPALERTMIGFQTVVDDVRNQLMTNVDDVDLEIAIQKLDFVESSGLEVGAGVAKLIEMVEQGHTTEAVAARQARSTKFDSSRVWTNDLISEFLRLQAKVLADQRATARKNARLGQIITVVALAALFGTLVFGRRLSKEATVRATEQAQHEETVRHGQQVEAFNQRLQDSNQDLQDFAYVASHDLQEPLRKITAFGERLRKRAGDDLDSRSLDYLDRMQNASSRMQRLIEDLLTFSRVSTQGGEFQVIDLDEVANGVLSDLEIAISEAGATVEIHDLPDVAADPSQMRQVLQNLIGNALKFRAEGVAPIVTVSATVIPSGHSDAPDNMLPKGVDSWMQLSVADNGIGFDMQYVDKVFAVFQRLHGRSEYEGSGVGLAVCRRIAERHGGELRATSGPGEGATFILSIPSMPTEKLPAKELLTEE